MRLAKKNVFDNIATICDTEEVYKAAKSPH